MVVSPVISTSANNPAPQVQRPVINQPRFPPSTTTAPSNATPSSGTTVMARRTTSSEGQYHLLNFVTRADCLYKTYQKCFIEMNE